MERRTIFVVGILFFTLIISGIGIYLYYQHQKTRQTTSPFSQNQPAKSGFGKSLPSQPILIDIKGSAIINGVDLLALTKTQVEKWSEQEDMVTIPAASVSVLSSLPEKLATFSARIATSSSTEILAGRFKKWGGFNLVLTQNNQEKTVGFAKNARLWLKKENNLQIASSFLPILVAEETINQFLKPNDLVLVMGIKKEEEKITASGLLVMIIGYFKLDL